MNTINILKALQTFRESRIGPGRGILLRGGLALLFCAVPITPLAGKVISNNDGYFLDDYLDTSGIVPPIQVRVAGGTVSLNPPNTLGNFRTVDIVPTSSDQWGKLTIAGTYGAVGDLTVQVFDLNDVSLLGPVPVNGPISLASLNLNLPLPPGIRVQVGFNKTGLVNPTVDSLRVTWNPVSQVLIDNQAAAQVLAGDTINYGIHYSVSYVEARSLVVWNTLPSYPGSVAYPTNYGQDDNPTFVSATQGGLYTSGGTTVNGVPVPPNSVYWDLGVKPEGTAEQLNFTVATRNGTLDGTTFSNRVHAKAANAALAQSLLAVTTIHSAPSPSLVKQEGSGIFDIGGELQTSAGATNSFSIIAQNNYQARGGETLYNAVVYDDVSALTNMVQDFAPAGPAGNFFNISPGDGTFNPAYDPDGPGGAPAFPAIVWNARTLAPGAVFSGSFAVRLKANPPEMQYINKACLTSDQTRTSPACDLIVVKLPLSNDTHGPPAASFKKFPSADIVPYGGTVAFSLSLKNKYAVKLNDIILLDKVPVNTTFLSAWIDDSLLIASGAKIFYSTSSLFPDPNTPPPVTYLQLPADLDEVGNTYWEPYPPAIPAAVTWVAYYIPQVDSVYLPNQLPLALPPTNAITSAAVHYDVKVFTPPNACSDTNLLNRGLFRAYKLTDLSGTKQTNSDGPLSFTADAQVVARGYKGELSASASISPDSVDVPGVSTYSLLVRNSAASTSDPLIGVEAVLHLSQVAVNGVLQYPSIQGLSPAGDTSVPGQITIPLDLMGVGASRFITLQLGFPAGILGKTNYTVSAMVTGADDQCGSSTVNNAAIGQVQSSPKLSVRKSAAADLIPSGTNYDYFLDYQNLGTGPSIGTWIVDRVPNKTVFVRAYGNTNLTAVWLSIEDNLPPPALTPLTPITADLIQNHFTQGIRNNNGTPDNPADDYWTPSGAVDPTKIYWIAWQVDEPFYHPPQFPINKLRRVGFNVRNDENGQLAGTAGSPQGTQMYNSAGIFSSVLPQAIGNQVITTINDQPSIVLAKTGPTEVEAGVPFEWVVTYHNNTLLILDDSVVITDILPPGITLLSASNTWNAQAVANNAPGGGGDQKVIPGISVAGGSTVLTFNIAGASGIRGMNTPLGPLEGGKLTLTVRSDSNTVSGTILGNTACGTATNSSDTVTSCADHQVTIFRPDLELRKSVSRSEVLAGGTLTYTLELANHGATAARNVALTDTLPPGVTYAGSLSVTPDYTIGTPFISGQTLTWSVTNGNALTKTGFPAGLVPDASIPDNIRIQFNVHVGAGVAGCTILSNLAHVSTVSFEEGVYTNDAIAIATVPAPDPAVVMSGPNLERPGNQVSWKLTWVNQSLQAATGVYLVDSLPNNDADSNSDVTFVNVTAPNGVTPYYHSGPVSPVPAFDPLNPSLTGWSTIATPPVNHVALDVGALAGNAVQFSAQVTVSLIDPVSHVLPAPGVSFTNRVVIGQANLQLCDNMSNNTATAVVRTPALDVALTKTGSVQGPIPGLAPGQSITYTLAFVNSGTVNAYGVNVTDNLPDTLVPGEPLDNFTVVRLVDGEGTTQVRPVDSSGHPIVEAVPVTRVVNNGSVKWYLGTTAPGDALYYENVGLPPRSQGSFQLYVSVTNSAADNTVVCNSATVAADVGTENVLANNTGQSCVTVRRADVAVHKSGVAVPGVEAGVVEFGGLITYTVEYNNLGGITAQDVRILDYVPAGTTLVSVNPPPLATVTYSPNPAEPTNATSFEVRFDALPAPANSVGGTVHSGSSLPGGQPKLDIQLVGQTVQVTWDAAYAGFILQKTPVLLDSSNLWTAVAAPVVAFPTNRLGVTLPIPGQACYFRLCGMPAPGCSPGTNQYFASVQSNCFFNWNRLFVKDTVPAGSVALYSVGRGTSGNVRFDLGPAYTHVSVGPNGLDLSGLSRLETNLVLQAEYSLTTGTNSPCLDAWQFTYDSPCWPSFTFTVLVNGRGADDCGPLPIDNRVSIGTTTPETDLVNNTARHDMNTLLTDLQLECAVNKTAALPGETLTHTINWSVAGPQGAPNAYLQLTLPDADGNGTGDVTVEVVTPGPGVTAYYSTAPTLAPPEFNPNNPTGWTTNKAGANHIVFNLGDRVAGSSNTITYTAMVKSGTGGLTLFSCVLGYTTRRETVCKNSCCTTTYIGTLANLHIEKTGPGCLHPGNLAAFTIRYGNNGNTSAANVVVTDVLPAGLTFVSAAPVPSTVALPNLTWNNVGATPGTLGPGETGVITVTARVANACTLIGQTLVNVASISTSNGQVSLADDRAEAVLNCITPDVAGLSGHVYDDQNGDCLRDPGEHGIEGVLITLTGIDACSNSVTLTTTTFSDGQYNFTGLNPGTYVVTETQPLSWFSTGDTLGMVGIGPLRGINTNLLDDVLGPITLFGGEFGLEYNFCENTVSGCLRVTNEVVTCVSNGTYRYTFCATNLFNGPINHVTLLDPPPGVTFTPDIITLATPLLPGQGQCFTVTIQGASMPSSGLCFRFGAHNTNFIQCCAIEHCLTLPQCCAEIVNDSAVPIPGQPNCYNYTFSLKNETTPPVPIQYLILLPDPANDCFRLTPDIIFLPTPLLPGQTVTRTLKLCVTPPCPAPFCFVLSAHDTNFDLCCSVQHCLTNAPIQHRPVVFADGFDGSVHSAGTNITVPLIIDTSIVQPSRVTVSVGTNVIRIINAPTNGPSNVTWNNVSAGVYTLTAAAQDDFGGVWFADPATVTVGAGRFLVARPRLLAPALAGGKVSFSMQTEAGVTCHVEYTESLSSPTWILLQSTVGDGSMMTVTDSFTNARQRFYRVRMR